MTTVQHSPSRLRFVDNLRILLTSLVVLHHIATMYGLPIWYYTEPPTSAGAQLGLTVFVLVDQAWFMGAFFLLSGYFTPASYDRGGPRAFLRDRLIRLGIPLLVFYFALSPLAHLGAHQDGSPLRWYLHAVGTGPLWFALALLVLDASYVAVRHAAGNRPPRDRQRPSRRAVIGFVLALALVSYALRIVIPIGFWVPIVDFPTSAYLPQYVGFFVVGTIAQRRGWLSAVTTRTGWAGLGAALGATLVFLPLALAGGLDGWSGRGTPSSLFYALWDSTFAVGITLALLALFRSRATAQGPLSRYLSGHAFTVYLIHALVVTAAGYALSGLHLPTVAKFAVASVLVLPASFLLAGPIRRLPGLRRVL